MSKKKNYSKHLIVGFFYLHGDCNGGHPAYLFSKNDRKNEYYIILFTSKPGKNRIQLKNNIDKRKQTPSYVLVLPKICKRSSLGSKVLTNLKISKQDKCLIETIKRKVVHRPVGLWVNH